MSPLVLLSKLATLVLSIIKALFPQNHCKKHGNRLLFVLAHPDDESMFFLPSIQHLIREGKEVHFVFLTKGNFDKIGDLRFKELDDALRKIGVFSLAPNTKTSQSSQKLHSVKDIQKINKHQRCIVIDREDWFMDTMDRSKVWNTDKGVEILDTVVRRWNIDQIMTFDQDGVSHHPNHISCYHITHQYLKSQTSKSISGYALDSRPIYRKYLSFWDVIPTAFFDQSYFILGESVEQVVKVMECHYSQWVWFRKLFVLFSSYSFINSWTKIDS